MQALPPVVAIGGSAGSIEALRAILTRLPALLPAAVLVVLHRSAVAEDERLPNVLGLRSALPTQHAVHKGEFAAGHVYVAPANLHLLAGRGRTLLSAGAKANHMRPSIDRLFFSVARNYGTRAIAVILSGLLDDGAAGLADIQAHGGRTLVQDPRDAAFAGMPRSALGRIEPDAVAAAGALAGIIVRYCEDFTSGSPATEKVADATAG